MATGLDKVDFAVLCALALAVSAYLGKDKVKNMLFSDNSLTTVTSDSRDIVQVAKENDKNYLVVYGSQTGTAEDYAKKFAKELAVKFQLKVMCVDVDGYEFENLNELSAEIPVSFFISTYGEGDFPDGAIGLEEYLDGLNAGDLENLRYTMFGFGNSTYEFYNGSSKKADKCLKESGATLIGSFGMADDGAGTTDEDYLSWKDNTFDALKDVLHLSEHEEKFEPTYKYSELEEVEEATYSLGEPHVCYLPSFKGEKGPFSHSVPFLAPVLKTKELFTSQDRNCIHAEIDLSDSNLKYQTGDHIGILPSNSNEKVEQFLKIFNLKADTVFNMESNDSTVKPPFPVPTTIGAAVRYYLEITGPVSRITFGQLVQFAPTPEIKTKVQTLSKNKEEFAKQITSKYFNLADALSYLSDGTPWSTVPWNFLAEILPHMQPRYYSISSSSSSEPNTVHITAVVENQPNPAGSGEQITGVTTNLLRNINLSQNNEATDSLPVHYDLNGPRNLYINHKLPIHIRHSQFRLPSNPSTPVIMIGPGTGVAPFRGFIRERIASLSPDQESVLGKHLLFYGSRNKDDYLYADEWPEYAKKLGSAFEMFVAHSRIGDRKIYVQDLLMEKQTEVFDLLKKGAFIYVCGDAKGMAQGVHKSLVEIISKCNNISEEDASATIKMMKTSGKYQEDVW